MQKLYKNIITALVGLVFSLAMAFSMPETAAGQQNLNLTVSPPIGYLKVAPGTKQTHTISIKNSGENAVEVTPTIVDFSVDPEDGRPIPSDKHSFPYFTMPDANLKPINIQPNQVAQLQLIVEPPATAEHKEFPLSVLFAAETNSAQAGEAKIAGTLASNLVILVSDQSSLEKKLVVSEFGAPKITDSFRGMAAAPVLKNERFSSAAASGSAKLVSWTGATIGEYQIYPDNILGLSSRPIRALKPDSDSPQVTDFEFDSPFLIGPYRLVIELDNDGQHDQFAQTIIALPFSILAAAVLGGLVGLIYWWKIRQKNHESLWKI